MEMTEFNKDRIEAFRSMDKSKVREYCRKYHIECPIESKKLEIMIHRARTELDFLTEEEREYSRKWLKARNISLGKRISLKNYDNDY